MTSLEPKAFARAKLEFDLASEKFAAMQSAPSLTDLAKYWSEFLTHVQRAFLKLKKASERGAAKGWYDTVEHFRNTDQLLGYLRHARNADEHGIDPITYETGGGIGIGPRHGNTLHIGRMEIHDGRIAIDSETAKNVKITFFPAKVTLAKVIDRGTSYAPPKVRMHGSVENGGPIAVAKVALKFLADTITEAEKR